MPYANRETQLSYMRTYAKRDRAIKRIIKLKADYERAKEVVASGEMRYFGERWLQQIVGNIKRKVQVVQECDGLLKTYATMCEPVQKEGLLKKSTELSNLEGTP